MNYTTNATYNVIINAVQEQNVKQHNEQKKIKKVSFYSFFDKHLKDYGHKYSSETLKTYRTNVRADAYFFFKKN